MPSHRPYFSILIPTWNSLSYLQSCLKSIKENSAYEHEVILHINEGKDGTLEWVKNQGLKYSYSPENIGVCRALNLSFSASSASYICFLNDDMYVLPDWDKYLYEEAKACSDDLFMISSTMIEPRDSGNSCVIVKDFGSSLQNFDECAILEANLKKTNWSGASWPPFIVSRSAWEKVGGFSEEFSPGYYSDPDFSIKLWQAGCRVFKGVGRSQVYHFMQKSTGKVKKNNGRIQFMKKWGIPASAFYKHYLRMGEPYNGPLPEPTKNLTLEKVKSKVLPCL